MTYPHWACPSTYPSRTCLGKYPALGMFKHVLLLPSGMFRHVPPRACLNMYSYFSECFSMYPFLGHVWACNPLSRFGHVSPSGMFGHVHSFSGMFRHVLSFPSYSSMFGHVPAVPSIKPSIDMTLYGNTLL